MARSSRRSSRSSNRSRSFCSRASSSRRNRAFLFGAVAMVSVLLVLTHASEPHLSADPTTTATTDDAAEDIFPATLDETKLGANLLPIFTSSNGKSNNSASAVFARLKQQVSAALGRFLASSDAACDWSWSQFKCAPSESCKLKPCFGDLHLGRACRLQTSEEEEEKKKEGGGEGRATKWVGAAWGKLKGGMGGAWRKVDNVRDRALHHTVRPFKTALGKVKAKLPETDKECKFDVVKSVAQRKMVCEPAESCAFQYKAGDVMLNRACRLKQDKALEMKAEGE